MTANAGSRASRVPGNTRQRRPERREQPVTTQSEALPNGAFIEEIDDEEEEEEASELEGYDDDDDDPRRYELDGQPLDLDATAAALLAQHQDEGMSPIVEHGFDLLIWGIPFSALYVLMDVMIHQQYALHPTVLDEFKRMATTLPVLFAVIWFTTIRPALPIRLLQPLLFLSAVTCGSAFIWVFHESSFMQVVRQTPPLGTLWVFSIVKLDLVPCIVSLSGVAAFIWWHDLPLLTTRI